MVSAGLAGKMYSQNVDVERLEQLDRSFLKPPFQHRCSDPHTPADDDSQRESVSGGSRLSADMSVVEPFTRGQNNRGTHKEAITNLRYDFGFVKRGNLPR